MKMSAYAEPALYCENPPLHSWRQPSMIRRKERGTLPWSVSSANWRQFSQPMLLATPA